MSLELCILASGSMGNCCALRTPAGTILIDAGIGPRSANQRMNGTGISLRDVRAICLTHLDRDHFRPSWLGTMLNRGIRVFCHRQRVDKLIELLDNEAAHEVISGFGDDFEPVDGLTVRAIPLAHDARGCHGFLIEGHGCRIGYATDLGHVPSHLLEAFEALDLLALESNYDPQMQLASSRPGFLKQRIMGGAGHLSNEQAYEAIRHVLDRHARQRRALPRHIVLLHRSRPCNCPKLLRRMFQRDPRIAPRLTLAEQFQRSDWLRVRKSEPLVGEQLALAFA